MIGTGILKGMGVTAGISSAATRKERLTTVQYPEERAPLPENYRNFPFLVHDGDDAHAGLRCVACQICEKECPPQCIYIVKSKDKKPDCVGKPQFYPATFDIDISVCMSCQICVEVCPFEAIKMDKVYELSRRERFDALLMNKDDLAKSNGYYHEIHPTRSRRGRRKPRRRRSRRGRKEEARRRSRPHLPRLAKPEASKAPSRSPTASADSAPPAPASPHTAEAGGDPRTPPAADLASGHPGINRATCRGPARSRTANVAAAEPTRTARRVIRRIAKSAPSA